MGTIRSRKTTPSKVNIPSQIRYSKPNVTKQWLLSHCFYYNRMFSDGDTTAYSLRFPVCEYNSHPTLEGELTIFLEDDNPESEIKLDVYTYGTYEIYPAFYYQYYGNYDVILATIWQNIDKKLRQLRIKKIERKEKSNGNSQIQEVKRERESSNKSDQSGGGLRLVRSNDIFKASNQIRPNVRNKNRHRG